MAIIRVEKTKDYTTMSNYHFREKDMSLKAKGLLSLILSLPEEWDYTLAGLAMLSKDGKDSVRTALTELEEFGYVETARVRDEKGRLKGTEYIVREMPVSSIPEKEVSVLEEPTLEKSVLEEPTLEKPILENPTLENPTLEKPTLENPTQLNTNISNTKKLNIYLSNHSGANNKLTNKPDSSRAYYPEDARLNEAFKAFVYMRKRINKPLTNKAIELTKESLAQMAAGVNGKMDIEKAIGILNQSVMNSWQSLCDLKIPTKSKEQQSEYNAYSADEWERLENLVVAN
ncbi:hypothetical protein IMSAGC011_03364 [Lachnospiraceae bacterium]|nr:hypothetical protein IMSAGC011_03364 [Lachnospiraceae bacterium]